MVSPALRAQLRMLAPFLVMYFTAGMTIGWASPALFILDTQYEGEKPFPTTSEQNSWVASFSDIGIFGGTLVCGYVFSRFGRRTTMLMAPVAQMVWALLTYFATSPEYLYVARFSAGISMAVIHMYAPIYFGEVATAGIRGPFTLISAAIFVAGTLSEFIVGPLVSWTAMAAITIPFPQLALLLSVLFLEESPYYYAMKGRYDDMTTALAKLRGATSEEDVEKEAYAIQTTVAEQMEEGTSLKKVFAEPGVRRAVIIVMVLNSAQGVYGNSTVMACGQIVFAETGSPIEGNVSVLIIIFAQALGLIICAKLVNILGRKPLQTYSLLVCGVCLGVVAGFLFLKEHFGTDLSSVFWIPLTILVLRSFSGGLGAYTLPEVLSGELLDQRTKNIVAPLTQIILSITSFGINKSFALLKDGVGMYVSFIIFTVFNLLGSLFCALFVPETKGKTLAELHDMLRGRNSNKERL